jgi:retron-type reverse transcriptase
VDSQTRQSNSSSNRHPTQQDRVAQEAIRGILESIYEPEFQEFEKINEYLCSNYRFRPHKCTFEELENLKIHGKRTNICIEGDIKSAYNSIEQNKLLSLLGRRIKDKKLLICIKNLLRSGIMDENRFDHTLKGNKEELFPPPPFSSIYTCSSLINLCIIILSYHTY